MREYSMYRVGVGIQAGMNIPFSFPGEGSDLLFQRVGVTPIIPQNIQHQT